MAGMFKFKFMSLKSDKKPKNSKKKLNSTLLFLINILNSNNIKNWFIGYGTLLGIVRENSCIDGDDDIDIICDKKNRSVLLKSMLKNGFKFTYGYGIGNSKKILKTVPTDTYASIDFYMASIDKRGNFKDEWENVIWSECYNENNELKKYIWNENIIYFPFNYKTKLINRYGKKWRIPQNNKGPSPRKKIL
tara:strand:- start:22 stop:594 length:573 start_codon:yes stop_codon:yes gene_type:complete